MLCSKCCRPSKWQAVLLVVPPHAWPAPEALLFCLLLRANLLHKLRPLMRLALALHPPYRLFRQSLTWPKPSTLHAALPPTTIGAESLAPLPGLHQPFVVGPGFSPVPAKLVSQIMAGKFVELHELLPLNIVLIEPDPQLLFDGHLVLTSPPKKPKRCIEDISTWLEAFSIYCLILVSYFPHRW